MNAYHPVLLLVTSINCAICAGMCWAGAWRGLRGHVPWRVSLATCVTFIDGIYWLTLFRVIEPLKSALAIRYLGNAMWFTLTMTAWSGIHYWRKEQKALKRVREDHDL